MKFKGLMGAAVTTGLIAAGFSLPAVAAHRAGAFSITPGIGYLWFDKKHRLKDADMPNITFGYDTSKNLTVQFLMGEFRARHTNRGGGNSTDGSLYLGNGVWHFNAGNMFEPYAFGGVGIMKINHPVSNNPPNQTLVNAGGGLEIFMAPSVSVHVDFRDMYNMMAGGANDIMGNFGVSVLLFGHKGAEAAAAANAPSSAEAAQNIPGPSMTSASTPVKVVATPANTSFASLG